MRRPSGTVRSTFFSGVNRHFFLDFKIPIGKGTFTIWGGKMIRKIVYFNIDFENGNCVVKKWFNTRVNNLFTRSFQLIRVSQVSFSQWIQWTFYLFSISSASWACFSSSSRSSLLIRVSLDSISEVRLSYSVRRADYNVSAVVPHCPRHLLSPWLPWRWWEPHKHASICSRFLYHEQICFWCVLKVPTLDWEIPLSWKLFLGCQTPGLHSQAKEEGNIDAAVVPVSILFVSLGPVFSRMKCSLDQKPISQTWTLNFWMFRFMFTFLRNPLGKAQS